MYIKRKISIRGRLRSSAGKVGLFLRLTLMGERREIALGISCDADHWDMQRQMAIGGDDASYINQIVANSRATLEDIVTRYELIEKRVPTMNEVVNEYKEKEGLVAKKDAVAHSLAHESIPSFIRWGLTTKGWSDSTARKFITLQKHLIAYPKALTFEDIDVNSLADFQRWCQVKLGHSNVTLQKQSKNLRWWLTWAKEKGLYEGNADEEYHPQYKGGNGDYKTIIFLEREELHRLCDYDFHASPYLERARDVFVFACYCGLRFSDVKKLKKTDIVGDNFRVVTKKTTDYLWLPLNDKTRLILDKYKNEEGRYALPVCSNQKMNVYIKECCRRAGIDQIVTEVTFYGSTSKERICPKWEAVTFHSSRKTFITMAFELNIPPEVVMKFSGHKRLENLKPYQAIVEKRKKDEMSKFNDL